ncbi:hypothetical protein FRC12_016275 [Ceratobasidium sp. 428]|nr:hypothetical protein FRC12_016275 [Ceratobasidium sp. 428]
MLQDIDEPTEDDLATLKVLLDAMRHGPEHEAQHGMLNAVLAGEAHFHGLEHIRLATASAQVDFQSRQHAPYYRLLIQFINENNPFDGVQFYGPGVRPPGSVHLAPKGSTVSYPNFYRYGVRYGADSHHRGRNSRYGYIYNQRPVLIKAIYEATLRVEGEEQKIVAVMVQRFMEPAARPIFPWSHRAEELGIQSWEFEELGPVEVFPATAFTGVFALSDIEMENGHYWLSFAMINTMPEDLVVDDD